MMRNKHKSLPPEELTPDKARVLALKYLSIRARTSKELFDYLLAKGFTEQLTSLILQEMVGYGYINDARFTTSFIGWKQERGWGPRKIAHALRAKGVEPDLEDTTIFAEEACYANCRRVAAKKLGTSGKVTRQALLRFLLGRGFTSKMAQKVVRELYEDIDAPNLDIPPKIY